MKTNMTYILLFLFLFISGFTQAKSFNINTLAPINPDEESLFFDAIQKQIDALSSDVKETEKNNIAQKIVTFFNKHYQHLHSEWQILSSNILLYNFANQIKQSSNKQKEFRLEHAKAIRDSMTSEDPWVKINAIDAMYFGDNETTPAQFLKKNFLPTFPITINEAVTFILEQAVNKNIEPVVRFKAIQTFIVNEQYIYDNIFLKSSKFFEIFNTLKEMSSLFEIFYNANQKPLFCLHFAIEMFVNNPSMAQALSSQLDDDQRYSQLRNTAINLIVKSLFSQDNRLRWSAWKAVSLSVVLEGENKRVINLAQNLNLGSHPTQTLAIGKALLTTRLIKTNNITLQEWDNAYTQKNPDSSIGIFLGGSYYDDTHELITNNPNPSKPQSLSKDQALATLIMSSILLRINETTLNLDKKSDFTRTKILKRLLLVANAPQIELGNSFLGFLSKLKDGDFKTWLMNVVKVKNQPLIYTKSFSGQDAA